MDAVMSKRRRAQIQPSHLRVREQSERRPSSGVIQFRTNCNRTRSVDSKNEEKITPLLCDAAFHHPPAAGFSQFKLRNCKGTLDDSELAMHYWGGGELVLH